MNRRHALTIGVGGVALAAGAGVGWWRERLPDAERALWALQFDRPEGGSLPLASLRGQPLLLNFWATWCAPCVKEMPLLDAFQRTHQPAGWRVVGLAVDSPTPVREFLQKLPVTFPIGLAGLTGVDLARSLGNDRGGLPFSAVFDRDGRVIARKLGSIAEQDLAAWVQRLA
ncbi:MULTISPECIES: TlpA disulfide reductase family protein [unclassified Rhizobacter]|uniref:TlpA family protein disulfide reductase n=1 Tax=unclassified Rhizobacter TaxID=2640088 RepID=UPI0006FCFFE1|nr:MULTISPECIES: TlpA disulfide reductase family protein [unclassified Rhizobacter]KQU67222.1 redoxin [Rhizobacter sp. Root29]KQW14634.1 redoxin [Rhizobacter sp. Root1238]KRB23989.1 redoxin [Rhizobacter sp. Root16D2]